MSSKNLNPEAYVTLEEAIELNNTKPAPQAWVFDKHLLHASRAPGVRAGDTPDQVRAKAANYMEIASSIKADPKVHLHCWRIHSLENFQNSEQMEYLKVREEFYYAPEKRFL